MGNSVDLSVMVRHLENISEDMADITRNTSNILTELIEIRKTLDEKK